MPVLLATMGVLCSSAQSAPAPPAQTQTPQSEPSHGQVIFSRSTDENGQTTTSTGPGAAPAALEKAPIADDSEREALSLTDFDLDVRLQAAAQHIAVRALVTVRNDGQIPLKHIPLQISSSLNWERIRADGHDAAFQAATLNSDSDHTGQLHEAALTPAEPLAPGATLKLDVTYSGTIAPNAQRLLALGTPEDVALRSDWDGIGVDFTGLRGFGDVVWYPVSSVPVILGDGARLFDEMGEHKLHMEGVRFKLRLTDEFPEGHAPTVAVINGHAAPLTVTGGSAEVSGVATASLEASTMGFEAASLFVAVRAPVKAAHATLWIAPGDEAAAQNWARAASAVMPFLESWLGPRAGAQWTVLDLPDPQDVPSETGAMVATPARHPPSATAHASARGP